MPSAIYFLLPNPPLLLLPANTSAPHRRRHYYPECHRHRHRLRPIYASSPSPLPIHTPPPEAGKPPDLGWNLIAAARKPLALTLFCVAAAAAPFFFPAKVHLAAAAPVATVSKTEGDLSTRHSFSNHTDAMLQVVGILLTRVRMTSSMADIRFVEAALRTVRVTREKLEVIILNSLENRLRLLRQRRAGLLAGAYKTWKIGDQNAREWVELQRREKAEDAETVEAVKDLAKKLEKNVENAKEAYGKLCERIWAIEEYAEVEEMLAYSVALQELVAIERESVLLVERLKENVKKRARLSLGQRFSCSLGQRFSKYAIREGLERVQRESLEQNILPQLVQAEDSEDFADDNTRKFILNIKNGFKVSRDLQKELEASIRKKYKRYGKERRFFLKTSNNDIAKGYPEAESKWVFGKREVILPRAVRLHLLHGWKQWREEVKASLKKKLLDDADFAKDYVKQRQAKILFHRDRLLAKTWYNMDKKRWEIDPVAVPFAISKKMLEHAHIRHDWAVMCVALKGDDKEYFVDIKEFDRLFEGFGGFNGLYLKLLASGTPTTIRVMTVPLSELKFEQWFPWLMKQLRISITGFWRSWMVSALRNVILTVIQNTTDDLMAAVGFPIFEMLVPKRIRMKFGMAWPEDKEYSATSSLYLTWQANARHRFNTQLKQGAFALLWFFIRSVVYCYVIYHAIRYTWRAIPSILGLGPYGTDPNLRKLRSLMDCFRIEVDAYARKKKEGKDPIKSAFENMKRVKDPPVSLSNFANIESMREQINEVVAFLQNPAAFQEMGARAPRGVLIVGGVGSGKTSLALAIAAEAKVPVVEVKPKQLEAGNWVGQSAANVRELFQTARNLAPVIIFVEDFDLFTGVRGKYIHTTEQDHEAFINQLLVELDGFEQQSGVVLLATTRNPKFIDEALRRPGRMDRIFYLEGPSQLERERILRQAAKETMDEDLVDHIDWGKIAEKTSLLKPMELRLLPVSLEASAFRNRFFDTDELITYCGWLATFSRYIPELLRQSPQVKKFSKWVIKHLDLELNKEDLQSVVDRMDPYGQISSGIELLGPPSDWSKETKLRHAIWAAGRGLIAVLLPNFDVVENIWLEPHSWEGIGCTKFTKSTSGSFSHGNVETRSYLEKKLVFCFGSYIASQMLLPPGQGNLLSQSELSQAQEIATRMVVQYGWGPDDSPAVYFYSKKRSLLSMGIAHKEEMGGKVEKIYNLAYDKAKSMLVRNFKVLEKIVEDLLAFESLTGEDLMEIVQEYGGARESEPFFLSEHHKEVSFAGLLGNGRETEVSLVGF